MSLPADDAEPDAALIERFRLGEGEAFDRIVKRYRRDVYRLCYRMTGTHEDADDAAQETFLRAFGALAGFRGDSALKSWLFRIAMNLTINMSRSKTVRRIEDRDIDAFPPAAGVEAAQGEQRLLADERARRVRGAVEGLPPRQRQVVILRMYEELQFNEIASVLDCPIGTAKANFFHAMQNLRRVLTA